MSHAEVLDTISGERLVCSHGKEDLRGPTQNGPHEEAATPVMQNDAGTWDEGFKIDVPLHAHMRWLRAESGGVEIASNCHYAGSIHFGECAENPIK